MKSVFRAEPIPAPTAAVVTGPRFPFLPVKAFHYRERDPTFRMIRPSNILTRALAVPRRGGAIILSAICLAVGLWVSACAPVIAPFSQRAYEYATELKVDSLRLIERAETPYGENTDRIERLTLEIEKAYEYARGRPNNEHSTRQWELLRDPEVNLLGGFLARWESEGTLSYAFIHESRRVISDAFDAVIDLESGKTRFDN